GFKRHKPPGKPGVRQQSGGPPAPFFVPGVFRIGASIYFSPIEKALVGQKNRVRQTFEVHCLSGQ
ncbi:hypothetical protein, partial [Zoogloea sp.]|uniref:hypothetical protein n=1 Tax=Zoogloea sp. TaxID=49181 RepID=UPI002D11440E